MFFSNGKGKLHLKNVHFHQNVCNKNFHQISLFFSHRSALTIGQNVPEVPFMDMSESFISYF